MTSGDHDPSAGHTGAEPANPWEDRKDRGNTSALMATLQLLATSPRRFFEGTRTEAGIWGPLFFVGVVSVVTGLLNGVVLLILSLTLPEPALDILYMTVFWVDPSQLHIPEEQDSFGRVVTVLVAFQFLLLSLPVAFAFVLFFTLVTGGLVHLLLIVTRTPRPKGFRGTWTAICYSNGANVLTIVPFVGTFLAWVWSAALFGIGLHVVQKVGRVRAAVLAVTLLLFPLLAVLSRFLVPGATGTGS